MRLGKTPVPQYPAPITTKNADAACIFPENEGNIFHKPYKNKYSEKSDTIQTFHLYKLSFHNIMTGNPEE